jgi:uncharacterized protein
VSFVFADTSGLYALLVASDARHGRARVLFEELAERQAPLLTHSYVLVETYALLRRRAGLDAVAGFRQRIQPLLEIVWVDQRLHEAGLDLLRERNRRELSLVDAVSFVAMREGGLEEVFAFDSGFEREGFTLLGKPGSPGDRPAL